MGIVFIHFFIFLAFVFLGKFVEPLLHRRGEEQGGKGLQPGSGGTVTGKGSTS